MKCYQYWPDEENTPMDFGDITVIVTNCEEWADYTVRTLQYTKVMPGGISGLLSLGVLHSQ